MSTPARSGTTQMMVESILAKYGWQKGWEIVTISPMVSLRWARPLTAMP
ncbi:phosphoglycerate transport regulatory protein PgtC [Vibrio cholerae]|nr:phosphoglycerate transport regulatory protein PgtC [Vibrio cholerae]